MPQYVTLYSILITEPDYYLLSFSLYMWGFRLQSSLFSLLFSSLIAAVSSSTATRHTACSISPRINISYIDWMKLPLQRITPPAYYIYRDEVDTPLPFRSLEYFYITMMSRRHFSIEHIGRLENSSIFHWPCRRQVMLYIWKLLRFLLADTT